MGQLGELNAPLLARTIEAITGISSKSSAVQKRANAQTFDFNKLPTEDEKGYYISEDPFKDLPYNPFDFELNN